MFDWPFSKKEQLIKLVDKLAFYNDKLVFYSKHSEEQAEACRQTFLNGIGSLVEGVNPNDLPSEFVEAFKNGDLKNDGTGRYVESLKKKFRKKS